MRRNGSERSSGSFRFRGQEQEVATRVLDLELRFRQCALEQFLQHAPFSIAEMETVKMTRGRTVCCGVVIAISAVYLAAIQLQTRIDDEAAAVLGRRNEPRRAAQ
jgi:hypothetical protein